MDSNIIFYSRGGGGGLMREGGIFAGFYGTWIHTIREYVIVYHS